MITLRKEFLTLGATASVLAACASESSRYPTLDIRPAERVQGTVNPVTPIERPSQPEVSGQTLAAITTRAGAAHTDFLAATPRATELAEGAVGAEVGSDAWAVAQVALADLDSARSKAAVSLGELDILYTDARLSFQTLEEIDAARQTVLAMLIEEDEILADLRAKVQ